MSDMMDMSEGWDDSGASFGGRAKRKAKRKARRARIKAKVKKVAKKTVKVAKKVVKNKAFQAIAKAALQIVPGGGVVVTAGQAAKTAANLVKSAKAKNPNTQAVLALAAKARKGDVKALATLKASAAGKVVPVVKAGTKAKAKAAPKKAAPKKVAPKKAAPVERALPMPKANEIVVRTSDGKVRTFDRRKL